jgi:hypothetical protein
MEHPLDGPTGRPTFEDQRRPFAAFIVSLLAGLWMLLTAGMMIAGRYGAQPTTMMDGDHNGQGGRAVSWWAWRPDLMSAHGPGSPWPTLGLIAGILVLIGALAILARPAKSRNWGLAILIASAVILAVGGAGFLACLLGIVGGILAMTWKPAVRGL